MGAKELGVKPPPPPQAGCTDADQWLKLTEAQRLRLAEAQRLFVRLEALQMNIHRMFGEFIETIDEVAAYVHELRRRHAEGEVFGADRLAKHVCYMERALGTLSAFARRCAEVRGMFVEMGGAFSRNQTMDELAAALRRIETSI